MTDHIQFHKNESSENLAENPNVREEWLAGRGSAGKAELADRRAFLGG